METTTDLLAGGLAHHQAGRAVAAEAAYRQVLAADAAQPAALYLYGLLLAERGDGVSALELLRRAAQLRPGDPESRVALANLLYRTGAQAQAEALWREVLAIDPGHRAAALNLAGTQRAAGNWREAVSTCRRGLEVQPAAAPLWGALALSLLAGAAMDAAMTAADAALELDDELAEAWFVRGTVLARRRSRRAALAALRRSLQIDPLCARAELNLGNTLMDLDCMEEAEPHLRRALRLAPDLPEAHASLGFLEASRHRLAAAIACQRQALALQPEFAEAHSNLAAALLLRGDYAAGFAEYEWRKRSPGRAASYWQSALPEWRGEDLAGRTILVFCEQGAGDTIMCARYLPLLAARGANIVVVCAAALGPLLRHLAGVVAVVPRGDPMSGNPVAAGAVLPAYDTWIDQMSLPLVCATTPERIPSAGGYVRADPLAVLEWWERLPGARRIGLAWAGNPAHSNDCRRSMRLSDLAPLLAAGDGRLISLQHGAPGAPPALGDLSSLLPDYGQTAALIARLDLVIAVDTSVAHLAGALGVPCWLMLPYAPEWRWMLDRTDSAWYASMRLFRQDRAGDWAGVVQRVVDAFRAWMESSSAEPC